LGLLILSSNMDRDEEIFGASFRNEQTSYNIHPFF